VDPVPRGRGVGEGTSLTPMYPEAAYCDRCGNPVDGGRHDGCRSARVLEPPRYCARCQRRMVVQVTPTGWTARCSEHGTTSGG
jgi:hypothetical protein